MAVTVRIEGLDKAKRAIRDLARLAPQKLRAAVTESAINIHRGAVMRTPVDTGLLRSDWKWEILPGGDITGVVYNEKKYAIFVEFGTQPHFPPIAPLQEWADRHGMGPGAGFLIARKIAQFGTPAVPMIHPAADAERNNFIGNVRFALLEAAQESAR